MQNGPVITPTYEEIVSTMKSRFRKLKERAKKVFDKLQKSYYGTSVLIINGERITDPEKIKLVDERFEKLNTKFGEVFDEMDKLFEDVL